MSDQQSKKPVEDLINNNVHVRENTDVEEPLEPLLKIMTDNKVLTETVSIVKMKLETSQDSTAKVGELTKELAEKLGPQVGKVLTNPKVKTLIDSVDEDKRGTLINQALDVFSSSSGINQIQTIIASSNSARSANETSSNFNLEPALNMARSFLELSKRRRI